MTATQTQASGAAFAGVLQRQGAAVVLVLGVAAAWFAFPHFGTADNLRSLVLQGSFLAVIALGMTFVIISGGIDLSVGSNYALGGVLAAYGAQYGLVVAILLPLAVCSLIGFINGLLIAKVGVPSFMATLATQFFWAGMATVLSGGQSYALRGVDQSSVWQVLVGRPFAGMGGPVWLGQMPMQAFWMAIIVIFLWFILNRHRFGEHTLFIGDSNAVSRVVGIDVDREKIKIFTVMGALAAVAALMLTLENKNYFGNQGQGYLLTAIASVLIGGTSIFGGRATVIGTVFGCFIIGMIEAGLVATGLTGAWVRTIQGLVFLTAIVFYLYVEEPGKRRAFLARFGRGSFGRPSAAG